jgi:hypothetical protein
MAKVLDERRLKQAVKEVLREELTRDPDWLRAVIAEILEDMALVRAIRRGRSSKVVSRAEIFRTLGDTP